MEPGKGCVQACRHTHRQALWLSQSVHEAVSHSHGDNRVFYMDTCSLLTMASFKYRLPKRTCRCLRTDTSTHLEMHACAQPASLLHSSDEAAKLASIHFDNLWKPCMKYGLSRPIRMDVDYR